MQSHLAIGFLYVPLPIVQGSGKTIIVDLPD